MKKLDITERVNTALAAIAAAISIRRDIPPVELLLPYLQNDKSLSSEEAAQLAKLMIVNFYRSNTIGFALALKKAFGNPPKSKDISMAESILESLIEPIESLVRMDNERQGHNDREVLDLACWFHHCLKIGKASKLLRTCGECMPLPLVDEYCHQLEEDIFGRSDRRQLLIVGIIQNKGPWPIWQLVRKYFLPEEALENESEIDRLKDEIKVLANLPATEEVSKKRNELFAKLIEISDNREDAVDWLRQVAPSAVNT